MTPRVWAVPTIAEMIHRRAWELMGDGDWYDYEAAVIELGKVIPPGLARRYAEATWLRRANTPSRLKGRGGQRITTRPRGELSDTELIRQGRRGMVVATLQHRGTRTKPSTYQFDPPVVATLGRNKWTNHEYAKSGRRVRVSGPNRTIKGDLIRADWLRPVLDHIATELGSKKLVDIVRRAAHEQGFHLQACPHDCTLAELAVPRANNPNRGSW